MKAGWDRDRFRLPRSASLLATFLVVLTLNTKINLQCLTEVYFLLALYYCWPNQIDVAETDSVGETVPRSLAIGALFCGGCYWSNYLGVQLITTIILGLFVFAGLRWRADGFRPNEARALGGFVVLCAVLVAPHMLRNYLAVGNPIYPGMIGVLGGEGFTEWFLKTRYFMAPLPVTFDLVAYMYMKCRPVLLLLLAAVVLVCPCRSIAREVRINVFMLISMFLLAWLLLLQITNTPAVRFLYPITPVAVICLVLYVWTMASASAFRALPLVLCAAMLTLPLLFQTLPLKLGLQYQPGGVGAKLFEEPQGPALLLWLVGSLSAVSVLVYCTTKPSEGVPSRVENKTGYAIMMAVLLALSIADWRRAPQATFARLMELAPYLLACAALIAVAYFLFRSRPYTARLSRYAVVCGSILICLVFLYKDMRPTKLFHHGCEIAADLNWMNDNLSDDALVMTIENRLFMLQRDFIPANDPRMQAFYEAESPEKALGVLKSLGITHVYHSGGNFEERFEPWSTCPMLVPAQTNAHMEIIYEGVGRDGQPLGKVGRFRV